MVMEHTADSGRKLGPVSAECRQALFPGLGNRVVPPRSLTFSHLPPAGDQAGVAEPVQQRIDGAITGEEPSSGSEITHKFQAEPGPKLQQGQHAWPKDSPAELGQAWLCHHALHDVL